MTQRDVFWAEWVKEAEKDPRMVLVTADMSAPALDDFRTNYPHRYINVGIAEQNMLLVAAGLAHEGFLPAVYAIEPFVSLRCYEQWKSVVCLMKLPILGVGVGAGVSYEDSGPTHHSIEDLAIMRVLPNMVVYNPGVVRDVLSLLQRARIRQDNNLPSYIRLDRMENTEVITGYEKAQHAHGYSAYHFAEPVPSTRQWATIIATGSMLSIACTAAKGKNVLVINVTEFPIKFDIPVPSNYPILVLEENSMLGGLYSAVQEACSGREMEHYALSNYYSSPYQYTRQAILDDNHLTVKEIQSWLKSVL